MPNTARAEKRKKPVLKRNLLTKRTKKNPIRTAEPERVGDSEVGIKAETLWIAPPTDDTRWSSPLHFDSTDTGYPSSPIKATNVTSRPSSKHATAEMQGSEPRQWALPPSNPPSSSPVAASIVSVGLRSTTNLSHLRSPHPSSSVSQQITSSPQHLGVTKTLQTPSSIASSGRRYSNRSKLSVGDLRVTAVIETTSLLMEKHLLTDQPFPKDSELKLVRPSSPISLKKHC